MFSGNDEPIARNMHTRRKRTSFEILTGILEEIVRGERVSRAHLIRSLGLNPHSLYKYLDHMSSKGLIEIIYGERGVYVKPLPYALRVYTLLRMLYELLYSDSLGYAYSMAVRRVKNALEEEYFHVSHTPCTLYDLIVEKDECRFRVALLLDNDPLTRMRLESLDVYRGSSLVAVNMSSERIGETDGLNVVHGIDELVSLLRRLCRG